MSRVDNRVCYKRLGDSDNPWVDGQRRDFSRLFPETKKMGREVQLQLFLQYLHTAVLDHHLTELNDSAENDGVAQAEIIGAIQGSAA